MQRQFIQAGIDFVRSPEVWRCEAGFNMQGSVQYHLQ